MIQRKSPQRQQEILRATLALMREQAAFSPDPGNPDNPDRAKTGKQPGLSTANIAARANCSKETIYNWFGNRDGLLAALVEAQGEAGLVALEKAAGMNATKAPDAAENLIGFCAALLDFLTGEANVLVLRVVIGDLAGTNFRAQNALHGRQQKIEALAVGLLEQARAKNLLDFDDTAQVYATLYGLLIAGSQMQSILGYSNIRASGEEMNHSARSAFERLQLLYPAASQA